MEEEEEAYRRDVGRGLQREDVEKVADVSSDLQILPTDDDIVNRYQSGLWEAKQLSGWG